MTEAPLAAINGARAASLSGNGSVGNDQTPLVHAIVQIDAVELSSQLFECVDVEACADRRGLCYACGYEWRWHTSGGMCQGTGDGVECHCVMIRPAA